MRKGLSKNIGEKKPSGYKYFDGDLQSMMNGKEDKR
jgi:hypothetical protein